AKGDAQPPAYARAPVPSPAQSPARPDGTQDDTDRRHRQARPGETAGRPAERRHAPAAVPAVRPLGHHPDGERPGRQRGEIAPGDREDVYRQERPGLPPPHTRPDQSPHPPPPPPP